ncbi:sulfotransferase family 2 domain-containing protein [Salipiger sp. 1_MG-2023]|uniref:sulfotransferase family 2 domain-containing protein n=1 Tax=Salipiger sp. 1_MG-2023 TaxID=3062665 RepID=UPI0026E468E4|nr:sulfotransferase family 2 domain-containing protein [Salipiger sp. 1_MG-2023]MDO6585463.1 sulfotransferase family 2 domain-containing protein [Salipiger sp. 1_MG-2023]
MVIAIDAHRIAYMALPKAGCSTVKAALAQIDPAVALPPEPAEVMQWHQIYPTRRFRPHRWEAYDHGWWRFCVVRDPLRRMLSAYVNRVVELGELRNSRKLLRGRVDLPMDPDPDFFFCNIAAYMDAASAIRHHMLPAWLFLGPDLARYDQIYRTAELAQLGRDLSARTGLRVDIRHENSSCLRLGLDDLRPDTQAALRERLAPEYLYFSGMFDNPFVTGRERACVAALRRVS